MPRKNVIQVVVSDETHRLVSGLADASGRSKSSVVNEYLLLASPIIERMLQTIERVKSMGDRERWLLQRDLFEAEKLTSDAFEEVMGTVKVAMPTGSEDLLRSLLPDKEAAPKKSPSTNRGVRMKIEKGSKPSGARVSGELSKNPIVRKKQGKKSAKKEVKNV